eukprot:scaffold14939_cov215-Amphora_coffeaeformis.AAC.8
MIDMLPATYSGTPTRKLGYLLWKKVVSCYHTPTKVLTTSESRFEIRWHFHGSSKVRQCGIPKNWQSHGSSEFRKCGLPNKGHFHGSSEVRKCGIPEY